MSSLFMASLTTTACAEEPASNTESGCKARQHADPVANSEKHLAAFKKELKITSNQEPTWGIYVEKTRSSVKDIRDRMNEATHEQPQTAPERFDRHIELMKERLANFEKMDEALKQLYAALTPEQKAIADRHFSRLRH
ncbi:Spy/CpxP family protein refolding chaperone [Sideroxyarcus emersonii]|nr:Spy/CpxP family protein refolding chaperone [Sideroxyarcus emersonii]